MKKLIFLILSTSSLLFADFIGVSADLRQGYAKGVSISWGRTLKSLPSVGYRLSLDKSLDNEFINESGIGKAKISRSCPVKGISNTKANEPKQTKIPKKVTKTFERDVDQIQLDMFESFKLPYNSSISPFVGVGYSITDGVWKEDMYFSGGLMLSYLYDSFLRFGISYEKDMDIRDYKVNSSMLKLMLGIGF